MLPFAILAPLALAACGDRPAESGPSGAQEPASTGLADAPLSEERRLLLEQAFTGTLGMPAVPHLKNRSRFQEELLTGALELGQLAFVADRVEQVGNWRQGVVAGELSLACLEAGHEEESLRFLTMAQALAADPGDETEQSWRRDRILNRIARVKRAMGEVDEAEGIAAALVGSERDAEGEVAKVSDEDFDAYLLQVEEVIRNGDFDAVQAGVRGVLVLHERFYTDEDRRRRCEEAIASTAKRVPLQVHAEAKIDLGLTAVDHGDREHALGFAAEAKALLDGKPLDLRQDLPLRSRIATLRWKAGEEESAVRSLDALVEVFLDKNHLIADVFCADALRPVAEAYAGMGQAAAAESTYLLVLEQGLRNINSRPRLEDTLHTALSLAKGGHEASEQLLGAVGEAFAGLGDPW